MKLSDCFTDRRSLAEIGGFLAYLRQVWHSLRALSGRGSR